MKRSAVVFVIASILSLVPVAAQATPHNEHAWANGSIHTLQITHESTVAGGKQSPEYVIAPVSTNAPLNEEEDGFGPYDLVVQQPQHNGGTYSSIFHVFIVVPDDNAPSGSVQWRTVNAGEGETVPLAYAADLGSGVVPLTSRARVEQAATLGLVDIVDLGITEVCHVVG
jgi:hypothetical protein